MSEPKTLKPGAGFFPTPNTKLAAALVTLGVSPCDSAGMRPIGNVYDAERPFAEGQPGHITYFLSDVSDFGRSVGELVTAWEKRGADQTLDTALAELKSALKSSDLPAARTAFAAVEHVFPLALCAYFRGYAENRERLIAAAKDSEPFLRFQRGGTAVAIVSKSHYDRLSPEEKRRFS